MDAAEEGIRKAKQAQQQYEQQGVPSLDHANEAQATEVPYLERCLNVQPRSTQLAACASLRPTL
jgi:hypothetical protein